MTARVGGSCTRISGVVLRGVHPSAGMWTSHGDTVLWILRIELRTPVARGQSPDAPKGVINSGLRPRSGVERRTANAPGESDTAMGSGGSNAGARTTAEVIRQGSRVSLCAGFMSWRPTSGTDTRAGTTGPSSHPVFVKRSRSVQATKCDAHNAERKTPHLAHGAGGA